MKLNPSKRAVELCVVYLGSPLDPKRSPLLGIGNVIFLLFPLNLGWDPCQRGISFENTFKLGLHQVRCVFLDNRKSIIDSLRSKRLTSVLAGTPLRSVRFVFCFLRFINAGNNQYGASLMVRTTFSNVFLKTPDLGK